MKKDKSSVWLANNIMRENGISSIISSILLITITVICATWVIATDIRLQKPPFVCAIEGRDVVAEGLGKTSDQIVELIHYSGDQVPVKDIEITVEVFRNNELVRTCTFKNFPWKQDIQISAGNIEGDQMIDRRKGQSYLGELSSNDGVWSAGERIGFRIKEDCTPPNNGIELKVGDEVRVLIIHSPTGTIIVDKSMIVKAQ